MLNTILFLSKNKERTEKMIGERKENRRLFTPDEKKRLLKENLGICACCGKPLTLKTMTVEHIIPISRGGVTEDKNLTILCYDCNQRKGNMVFLPVGFYSALRCTKRFGEIEKYTRDWFQSIKDHFDIERYPLIAPSFSVQLDAPSRARPSGKRPPFVQQFIVEFRLVGSDSFEWIQKKTGVDLEKEKAFIRHSIHKGENARKNPPIAIYSVQKLSNNKIYAFFLVKFNKATKQLDIYVPWHCMSKHFSKALLGIFVEDLLYAIRGVAGYDIYNYTVFSFDKEQIYNNKRFPGLAGKSRYLTDTLVNKNTGEKIYIYDMELDSIHNFIENNCKPSMSQANSCRTDQKGERK